MRAMIFALLLPGCGSSDFTPYSLVSSVRILATAADDPAPVPGKTVELTALAFDGRATRPQAMTLYWFPDPCSDPTGDGYFQCYPALRAKYPTGVDLTSRLIAAPNLTITISPDVITNHVGVRGTQPYGLTVVFMMACAGHIEAVAAPAGQGVEAIPFGCFDDTGHALDPDNWAFSYSSLFSFSDQPNKNPVIDHLTYAGATIDLTAGITVPHCTASVIDDCSTLELDTVVPDSSQELDAGNIDIAGNVLKEQVWVDYLLTGGKVDGDAVVLFDPRIGKVPMTGDKFFPPLTAGDYVLWAIVRDDRSGAAWLTIPLHAL